ncbi:hypothetical protein [Kutzneria sp. CA-103260]|uniref:hypothetical protein n=1 Tax=Kutzneria sp. CA-103260 TaxID=2802641 RepID=UPI001BA50BD5|nr:hypothetical protein [Kutzneria sp. CA-103260]QUQ65119.1 hypothetical protein JJ691_28400 [Kutzneria sp. CA-103260]
MFRTLVAAALVMGVTVTDPHVVTHLDLAAGQQPENLAVEADGSVDATFSFARQIAHISPGGAVHIVGTVPAPPAGTDVPLIHRAFVGGIVRTDDGTLYFLYAAGTSELTGLWRLRPGGVPVRIAALPADSVPNGLALAEGQLYLSDSALATVWRVPLCGGTLVRWRSGPELAAPAGQFGANGLKIRDHAVWVTNFTQGTLLRIPFGGGPIRTVATGLDTPDDFDFAGPDALVATNPTKSLELVHPDGRHESVLTGLDNPSAVVVRGDTAYVADAAYFSADPNLLTVHIGR